MFPRFLENICSNVTMSKTKFIDESEILTENIGDLQILLESVNTKIGNNDQGINEIYGNLTTDYQQHTIYTGS